MKGSGLKRLLDLALALVGLAAAAPLALCAVAAIVLDTGLPVLYRQERAGAGGRTFASMKFRSMRADAEARTGPIQAAPSDSRVTRVGRLLRGLALDELPQLANILKGDMSVVGPRALRPVEIEAGDGRPRSMREYDGFRERSSVRPGLTGVAQLLLPRDAPRALKFGYDVWYVRHRTFRLDFELLIASILVTVRAGWEEPSGKPFLRALRTRVEGTLAAKD